MLIFGLLLSPLANAEILVTERPIDTTTGGDFRGVYGSCFTVVPQASPRTQLPEVPVGPELFTVDPGAYDNLAPAPGDPSSAVCVTERELVTTAPQFFDFRVFKGPEESNAFAWSFNEPGTGTRFDVVPGSSQFNACLDTFRAATFDNDAFAADPMSGELVIKSGGNATVAFYFLTAAASCREHNYRLLINDDPVPVAMGSIGDFAVGKYLVFDIEGLPNGVETRVRLEVEDTPGTPVCPSTGATASGGVNSVISSILVDGTNACSQPAIDILKEVSVDGGITFFDANDSASAPATGIGGDALYRFTVTNTGSDDLENVVVNDATLGVVDFPVGNLAAGQTIVLTAGEIPALEQPGRCQIPGDVTNIAMVDGQSVFGGTPVMDSDPAVVRCAEEDIRLIKEVSIDGGLTFFDANDGASAPIAALGDGALYRLTVTNNGTSDLADVVVNDAELGIVNFPVGDLPAGQTVVLTSGEIPALEQPGRCEIPGDVTNIATVDGLSLDTGNTLSDSDPAVVRCVEEAILIVKEVSVDGGATFFDANDGASAPVAALGGDALYRLTVTNTGTSDLSNVVVSDAELGILDFPVGDLAAGESVVLTAGEIPALEQPGRCREPGDVANIATVEAQSATGSTVSDSDPAIVRCAEEDIKLIKKVSVDGGRTYHDANDGASAPTAGLGEGAKYLLKVINTGTTDLINVVVNDATLGIVDFPVGDLAVGQRVVLTKDDIPALRQPHVCRYPGEVTNIASVEGQSVVTGNTVSDSDPAVVICRRGGEGCTPGFWKQRHHFPAWPNPPYGPYTRFSAVFENAFHHKKLLDVLKLRGGGIKALGRHTVAALLNAANSDVDYDLTEQQVIDGFNTAFLSGNRHLIEAQKNRFAAFNEQGCPINGKSRPGHGDDDDDDRHGDRDDDDGHGGRDDDDDDDDDDHGDRDDRDRDPKPRRNPRGHDGDDD